MKANNNSIYKYAILKYQSVPINLKLHVAVYLET